MNMQIKLGTSTNKPLIVAQTPKETPAKSLPSRVNANGDIYECSTGKDGPLWFLGLGEQRTYLIQLNLTDSVKTKEIKSFSGNNAEKKCKVELANLQNKNR